jgi:hypothetical protein
MSTICLSEKTFNNRNNENLFDCRKILIVIGIIINIIFILSCFIKQINGYDIKNKENNLKYYKGNTESNFDIKKIQTFLKNVKKDNYNYNSPNKYQELLLKYEMNMPHLKDLNKKRTFNNRLPLPNKIDCQPHFFSLEELIAFMSFLTKDTIFFETGSGCSSIIANYYAKKVISIEGSKIWYEKGIKKGLSNSLIFKDLKSDDNNWSVPGKNSKIKDWKNYFQSYKKEYNADVIFIDGRFKVATAMDVFNKIKDDTIILIHEYKSRPSYFVLEEYYNYVYHWNTLYALTKKKEIKEIPLEIQKKYWNEFI